MGAKHKPAASWYAEDQSCPFKVGDYVRFTPSKRTLGLYQSIERFGVGVGDVRQIEAIKDDLYLFFGSDQGGWPWNEFALVESRRPPIKALTEMDKQQILERGWEVVQEARARTRGVSEKSIAKIIDAAVRKVRGRKK